MQSIFFNRGGKAGQLAVFFAFLTLFLQGCKKEIGSLQDNPEGAVTAMARGTGKPPQLMKDFIQTNLVANTAGYGAARIDPTLVNPWGLAFNTLNAAGISWPASQGTRLSQVYTSEGLEARAPVAIPGFIGPTGVVFNGGTGFQLPTNNLPARFIFAGLDGIISGWNGGNSAILMVANTGSSVYTGLALAAHAGAGYLYAADFRGAEIDVFNSSFQTVNTMAFEDPSLPDGYAPFNIENVGGKLYVMYAKVGPDGRDVKAPGEGYVSIFNTDGTFERRLVSRGQLNAPWGVTRAPAGFFGEDNGGGHALASAILVGNFGDGHINAYTEDGRYLGQLRAHGEPIVIDGLWAITFPHAGANPAIRNRLYFTAGPNHEKDGLFGYIAK